MAFTRSTIVSVAKKIITKPEKIDEVFAKFTDDVTLCAEAYEENKDIISSFLQKNGELNAYSERWKQIGKDLRQLSVDTDDYQYIEVNPSQKMRLINTAIVMIADMMKTVEPTANILAALPVEEGMQKDVKEFVYGMDTKLRAMRKDLQTVATRETYLAYR